MPKPNGMLERFLRVYNIQPPEWKPPTWGSAQITETSLDAMRQYAEDDVKSAIAWYYAKKPWKAWGSQVLKLATLLATALGGLIPIIAAFGWSPFHGGTAQVNTLQFNQVGYLCFALAAAFLGFDRYFGYSTGWMRYITTAMALETALRNFRLDWARATAAQGGVAPSGENLEALLKKIQDFCVAARALVEKETQAWVTEFQSNLSELEKDAKAAIEKAKSSVNNAETDAKRPGAIALTVENFADLEGGYDVCINDKSRLTAVTTRTTNIMDVPPGLHDLVVKGTITGAPAHASAIVTVEPAGKVDVSVTLVKVKAASG